MKPSLVIALHGLGANGADLAPLQQMMNLTQVPWLLPDAPSMPVSVNGGLSMPAWFDIYGFSATDPVDAQGIARSVQQIHRLLDAQQQAGVDISRAVLFGFSQGGVIALHAALSYSQAIGAVVGLSTWLPAAEQLAPVSLDNRHIPIWLGHGQFDEIVPMAAHQRALQALAELAVQSVTSHYYPMAHSILPAEIEAVTSWLASEQGASK